MLQIVMKHYAYLSLLEEKVHAVTQTEGCWKIRACYRRDLHVVNRMSRERDGWDVWSVRSLGAGLSRAHQTRSPLPALFFFFFSFSSLLLSPHSLSHTLPSPSPLSHPFLNQTPGNENRQWPTREPSPTIHQH